MQEDLAAETEELAIAIKTQSSVAEGLKTARHAQAQEREAGDGAQIRE